MTDKPTKSADQLDDLTDEVLDNDFDADEGETWEDQNAESQSKPKKKSSLFTLILIVGGAMVFAGIIYVQMGSLPPHRFPDPYVPLSKPRLLLIQMRRPRRRIKPRRHSPRQTYQWSLNRQPRRP
jgi:hypothetical protein